MYGVVNCRDVAFHKNHLKMVGLHFIRVFCFVRTFNKKIHVVHAFHKPYSFMKCPGSHPPGIRRGMVFIYPLSLKKLVADWLVVKIHSLEINYNSINT